MEIFFFFLVFGAIWMFTQMSSDSDEQRKMALLMAELSREFQVQLKETRLGDSDSGPLVKEIEGKGMFPLVRETNIGFVISVFDQTSGNLVPMLSHLEAFQEEDSPVYQHMTEIGLTKPHHGFSRWVRVGVVIPDILQPPYGGSREIAVIIRLVDLDNMPYIEHGFDQREDEGIIRQWDLEFEWLFDEKGYLEEREHRDEAVGLAIRIGMAVAMADGSLDNEEGDVLKRWILKSIAPFSDEQRERLKSQYNKAMKESYSEAKNGSLSLSQLTSRLNEIGSKADKYETIELCFEIMAADTVAESNELKVIGSVAQALGLDMNEVSKMRDQKILGLSSDDSEQASIETILGIESDWTSEQIVKHLRLEFQKWNNRLNVLEEGEERDNAQTMLDRIAEARKKYVS